MLLLHSYRRATATKREIVLHVPGNRADVRGRFPTFAEALAFCDAENYYLPETLHREAGVTS